MCCFAWRPKHFYLIWPKHLILRGCFDSNIKYHLADRMSTVCSLNLCQQDYIGQKCKSRFSNKNSETFIETFNNFLVWRHFKHFILWNLSFPNLHFFNLKQFYLSEPKSEILFIVYYSSLANRTCPYITNLSKYFVWVMFYVIICWYTPKLVLPTYKFDGVHHLFHFLGFIWKHNSGLDPVSKIEYVD